MDLNTLLQAYKAIFLWNKSRIDCFLGMILGLVISGNVQQHKCAVGFQGKALTESYCRRMRRFLADFKIDFCSMAKTLMTFSRLVGPVDLVLDRTNWKFGRVHHNLLILAVVVSGRFAFPIFWVSLNKGGSSNYQERIDLVSLFIQTFGPERIRSLTGDREFIGENWVSFLLDKKIPFYMRVKQNQLIDWHGAQVPLARVFDRVERHKKLCHPFQMQKKKLCFGATRSADGELVIIMTNQEKSAQEILRIYKNRWTIELMFRHAKTNGLNLEHTHLTDPCRLEKLMAVVTSALLLVYFVGVAQEAHRSTPHRKTVGTPLFSTFRRGFDYINRLLIHEKQLAIKLIYYTLFPLRPVPLVPHL